MTDGRQTPSTATARALWEVGQECDDVREVDVRELARAALDRRDAWRDDDGQTELDAFGGDGR